MTTSKKWPLLWPMIAVLLVPLAAAWFMYPATHLPPGFGVFPPEFVKPQPPFWLPYFMLMLAVVAVIVLFLAVPSLFGFKPVAPGPTPAPAKLPPWFWIGVVLTAFFWWLMWARVTVFGPLVYYAFSPLWWGFILLIDGLVYRRTGGRSLLASRPRTLLWSAVVSVGGWTLFEYLDYFVLGNWFYPNGRMDPPGHAMVVLLFFIAYTTVWPAIFEWTTLLRTFPRLVARYAQGPALPLPGGWLIGGGLVLLGLMVFLPLPLFFVLWIGPLAILAGQMLRLKLWTPLSDLAAGNWSSTVLVALASLANGFFWELWNWGSAQPKSLPATNPNYWIYDIPYVNVIHICAEMPLLGYAGYLPFGILAWVLFCWAGELLGFDTKLDL
ncbi:MAG TPA: hypothetical protein VF169_18590 [Albitalea sp.]|uniref:hypothetical protein n=1 Tax=Piscinibacter sp. TaxID=1903157 RepID=UPI002ED5E8E2